MSHSPAPWAIMPLASARDDDHCGGIVDAKGEFIVETDSGYYAPILADARLMVAAPDLLVALKDLCAGWINHSAEDMQARWRRAEAAIAKAEGR